MNCKKCDAPMGPGLALEQTISRGVPDFPGSDTVVTMSAGGSGKIVECRKCPECGWSVS